MKSRSAVAVVSLPTVSALSILSLPSRAQEGSAAPKDPPHSQNASPLDKRFVMDASQAGIAEVDAGRMAVQKASSADIRAFAQKMVDDHSKANLELASAANKAGLTPARETDAAHKSAADTLSGLSGNAFDRAYVNMQLEDHRKAVALFKDEAAKGGNLDLKEFADKTLPTLEKHLKHVEGVKSANSL